MPKTVTMTVAAMQEMIRRADATGFRINLPYRANEAMRTIELGAFSYGEDPVLTFRKQVNGSTVDEVQIRVSEIFGLAPLVRAILERQAKGGKS